MAIFSLQRVALTGLFLLASCTNHRRSSDFRTAPVIWGPGQWNVVEVHVLDSTLPDPPTFDIGDAITIELDRIVSERRGAIEQPLSRAAIESRLGFELDEYVNHSPSPLSVELTFVADHSAQPDGYRLEYALRVYAGDWGMPPMAQEDWVLDHPDLGRAFWHAAYTLAPNPKPLGD